MKAVLLAAALAIGTGSVAQAQSCAGMQPQSGAQVDPNGPNMPPGDGITRTGANPGGQPYTPPGFNQGMNVYPAAVNAPGAMPGMTEYPRCTRQMADRCAQGYARRPAKKARRR